MNAVLFPRRLLGTGAAVLVGLAVGCSHNCRQCDKPAAVCATKAPPATLALIVPVSPENRPIAPPSPLPITTLPPVSNERYIPPEKPAQIVTTEKPKLDESLVKPTDVAEVPMIRRSFPDITAKPEFKHATDYSCLVGELNYVPQKNQWRLRFASIDEEDRYGGSVTLNGGEHMMKDYRSGMLVRVEGSLVDVEAREPSPVYRVRDIEPLKK